ncbi:MAG: hypothetical protein L0332_35910 [Chloroflexi bacterium]|nr:hypothetical protein [Chloroflexota bacterium]MCI0578855.1 hypothetical protein [Chloroflexota bacterium]MCI0643951.1 hypothetical protein [Chloroflexota bacterium]MCI0732084.1 hypothetical protein [Chloroflexota bacterium]
MKTILGNETDDMKANEIEADVIVTAVALGFVGTRWYLDQPCRFDVEHPSPKEYDVWHPTDVGQRRMKPDKEEEFLKDYQAFLHVMSAMSYVLDKNDPGLGAFLKAAQSAEWAPGALITGRAGGEMLEADERHKRMRGRWSRHFAGLVTERPTWTEVYEGRGAYTGMIDDPVNDDIMIQPTKRVIDNDTNRWHPGLDYVNWGLIKGPAEKGLADINLRADRKLGMGPLPGDVRAPERIGYIHGMSSAINRCVSSGAWCTPYELATGEVTTKMASCFACTTYMYAAGFPPSSIHLGRGESWIPPAPHLVSGEKDDMAMPIHYENAITQSLATRWHWEIYHYLRLGSRYLYRAMEVQEEDQRALDSAGIEKTVIKYVNPTHVVPVIALKTALEQLWRKHLDQAADIGSVGGNLFLDALTMHDSDWKRVGRTLQPVNDYYVNEAAAALTKTEQERLAMKIAAGDILVG